MNPDAELVNEYLAAFLSGDAEKALSLVSDDFSFRGPMQRITGKQTWAKVIGHVATGTRGSRILRQWADGAEVCTMYELDVDGPAGSTSVLLCEWDTVRGGLVASSVLVFDTGPFQRPRRASAPDADTVVDPVCGMTVDAVTAPAHRSRAGRAYHFCSPGCAGVFDANPEPYLATT